MQRLTGTAASPGVAWGPAVLLRQHPLALRYAVAPEAVARELARLDRAEGLAREQLAEIRRRVSATAGPDLAQLFEAQLLMLDDRLLVPRARDIVAADLVNAEWAVQRAFDDICAVFASVGDDYLRERRGDVADVVGRLRRNLHMAGGDRRDLLGGLAEGSVLVADDLPPSVAGQLDPRRVVGLVMDGGSYTHHSAILARSLGIPAVVGSASATGAVRPGAVVLVDGTAGVVVVDPEPAAIEAARARQGRGRARRRGSPVAAAAPAQTADGVAVTIEANIELPSETAAARAAGAQGIGLVRSEYLLGSQAVDTLSETQQFEIYRDLAAGMAPLPVTIRTFDLDEAQAEGRGGLREDGGGDAPRGPLGMRAIRLSLSMSQREVFGRQLRALVRAARHGQVRVLFPFVTSLDELRDARAALRAVEAEVAAADGLRPVIPVGAMIEVPSAALTTDLLADEVDFLSIGTNDLVQYCLAVDRSDGRMAGLYEPLHPAILRVIRFVLTAARSRHRTVSVCGEMAGDPASLAVLLGLGVRALSMNPASISGARALIGQMTLRESWDLARAALRKRTGHDVAALVADALARFRGREGPAGVNGGRDRE